MDKEARIRREQGGRLRLAREQAGFRSAREAAIQNGWPESSYRAHESGSRTIGHDDAERYARRYRARGIHVSAKSILFATEPGDEVVRDRRGRPDAPLLSFVQAGALMDVGDIASQSDAKRVPVGDLPSGDWIALRIHGDSMDRIAPEGAIILVDRSDKKLVTNRYYVFSLRGEATFKRYVAKPIKRLEPFSLNQAHQVIYPTSDLTVVGRVHRVIVDL
jgi:SOS-response transcriptional repressor LexA